MACCNKTRQSEYKHKVAGVANVADVILKSFDIVIVDFKFIYQFFYSNRAF